MWPDGRLRTPRVRRARCRADPPASGLGPPDALPVPVDPFPGAGFGKPLGGFGKGLPEAPGDGAFLGRTRLGKAVRMPVPVRRSADAHGVFGVEVPGAFAADGQMPTGVTLKRAIAIRTPSMSGTASVLRSRWSGS